MTLKVVLTSLVAACFCSSFDTWTIVSNDSPVTITGNDGFTLYPSTTRQFTITYGDWDYYTDGSAYQFRGNIGGTGTLTWPSYPVFAISSISSSSTAYSYSVVYQADAYYSPPAGNLLEVVSIKWVDAATGLAKDDDKTVTMTITLH